MRGSVPLGFIDSAVLNVLPGQSVAEVDGERFATSQQEFGASGLAGVWAEENTREAIYAAFRRKETFGTSGPRIRIRFFAGYGFPDNLLDTSDGLHEPTLMASPWELICLQTWPTKKYQRMRPRNLRFGLRRTPTVPRCGDCK